MVNKILKTNALVLSYEMLSEEEKVLKNQIFNFTPENVNDEDL